MWDTLILTVVIFVLCFFGLGLGYFVRGRALRRGCQNAARLMGEDTCACTKKPKTMCPSKDTSGLLAMAELGNPSRNLKDCGHSHSHPV